MENQARIYLITSPDGKIYIGSTTLPLNIRMSNHRSDARLNKGNARLYQAMRQADPYQFTIEEIDVVPLDRRYQAEGEAIMQHEAHTDRGYNQQIPGRDPRELRREYRRTHPEIIRAQRQRRAARQIERRRVIDEMALGKWVVVHEEVINGQQGNE